MCDEYHDFEARYRKEINDGDTRCGRSCSSVVMELDKQIKLGHLLLSTRECRTCGERKNLIESFYRTRKDRGSVASSYSYECKTCTIQRILENRRKENPFPEWNYPDW